MSQPIPLVIGIMYAPPNCRLINNERIAHNDCIIFDIVMPDGTMVENKFYLPYNFLSTEKRGKLN